MKHALLGNQTRGILFIVSAPAGTGKTTLVRMLTAEFPSVVENISYTTREPRTEEVPGRDYHFISKGEFAKKEEAGEFLESAVVFGQYYGTSKTDVEALLDKGKHVVLVIDTQGALKLRDKVSACFIFIAPPTLEELRKRLFRRDSDSEQSIETRLSWAEREMKAGQTKYDYYVINDNLEQAYEILRSVLIAEEHKNRK